VTRSAGLALRGDGFPLERTGDAIGRATPFLLGGLVPGIVAADQGGYWPTAWGWTTIALAWVAGLALVLRAGRISGLELTFVGALAALTAWTGASVAWTSSTTQSVLSVERLLVYVVGAAAVAAAVRAGSHRALLWGVWAGSTAVVLYGLLTRLLPGRLGSTSATAGFRLAEPVGYWNGLGCLAALTAILALGLATFGRPVAVRPLAAASLPLILPTLYLTFSRGAWLALAAAVVAFLALSDRRLAALVALFVLAAPVVAAVWLAERSRALHVTTVTLAAQTRAGHTLLWQLPLLALGAAALAVLLYLAGRAISFPAVVRRGFAAAVGIAVVAAVVVGFAHYGGPVEAYHRAHHSIEGAPAGNAQNLNSRLFSLSSNGRLPQWRVALAERRDHPLLGGGAGTYAEYWAAAGKNQPQIVNVHNLYLETLAELGPIGLALLVVALAVPLVAAIRARRRALVPVAAGAWVAFLLHVAYDWDWQLTGVTLAALFSAGAILVAARSPQIPQGAPARRWGVLAVAVAGGLLGFYGLLGNRALARSTDAFANGDYARAATLAHDARRWAPWSSDPWQQLAVVRTARGDRAGALAAYREAVAKDPRDWQLWLGLASVSKGSERRHAVNVLRKLDPGVGAAVTP
jgi:O-antigen ligase